MPRRSTSRRLAHSRPASDYVAVDLELPGCPINKHQLLGVLGQMLAGSRPKVPNHCALPRLQAAAPGVRSGGPRHTVHGTGHVHRLRRALPELRSALLQLLRPERPAQHGGARPAVRATGAQAGGDPAALPRRSTPTPPSSRRQGNAMSNQLNRRMRSSGRDAPAEPGSGPSGSRPWPASRARER